MTRVSVLHTKRVTNHAPHNNTQGPYLTPPYTTIQLAPVPYETPPSRLWKRLLPSAVVDGIPDT
jgi:hypothetical protein